MRKSNKVNLDMFRVVPSEESDTASLLAYSDAPYVLEAMLPDPGNRWWPAWRAVWGLDRDVPVEDAVEDFDYLDDLLQNYPQLRATPYIEPVKKVDEIDDMDVWIAICHHDGTETEGYALEGKGIDGSTDFYVDDPRNMPESNLVDGWRLPAYKTEMEM